MNPLPNKSITLTWLMRGCEALVALCASTAMLQAQPALQIAWPPAGTTVSSGQTVTVVVAASGGAFQAVELFGSATGNG